MKTFSALLLTLVSVSSFATCRSGQSKSALFLAKPAMKKMIPLLSADPSGRGEPNIINEYSENKCDLAHAKVVCRGDDYTVTVRCRDIELIVTGFAAEEDGDIETVTAKRFKGEN